MDELTQYQRAILDRIDVATALGVVAACLVVMLLSIIAVRALWSR